MVPLPQSLRRLIKELATIPSIGPRQATRIAFYLASENKKLAEALGYAFYGLVKDIKTCARCFFIFDAEGDLCEFCASPAREQNLVMVVEKETDLISLENTGKFRGRYLVLGEMPKTGLLEDWQKKRLQALKDFLEKEYKGKAREIILALNPTSLGDFHASLLTKELKDYAEKISRLGRGLPQGGEVEFADDETLGSAIENRS